MRSRVALRRLGNVRPAPAADQTTKRCGAASPDQPFDAWCSILSADRQDWVRSGISLRRLCPLHEARSVDYVPPQTGGNEGATQPGASGGGTRVAF